MRFGCRRVSRLMVAGAALLAAAAPDPARADAVADFYKGKTVKIIVGFGVGGGYDIYARLAAEYLDASCRATRR